MSSRFIASLVAMTICFAASAQKVATPDFAFPEKVEKQSQAALKKALKNGDAPATVGELVKYTLAKTAVDADNVNTAISVIERTRAEVSDSLSTAMIDMLLAEVYRQAYMRRSWEYDGRSLPLTPYPADVNQWSGDQFRACVDALTSRALDKAELLQHADIAKWGSVLEFDKLTPVYYPTLYDFAVCRTINAITDMNRISDVVPLRALSLPLGTAHVSHQVASRILSLYDALIRFHAAGSPAARIKAQTDRISFLSEHLNRWDIGRKQYIGSLSRFGDYIHDDSDKKLILARLREIYELELSHTEFAGEALIACNGHIDASNTWDYDKPEIKWYHNAISDFMRRYPAFARIDCLRNIRSKLEEPKMTVDTKDCFAPGVPVEIKVDAANVTDGRIDIYKVSDDAFSSLERFNPMSAGKPVGSFAVSVGDTLLCNGSMKLKFTFEREGAYIIVPVVNGNPVDRSDYSRVWCTKLAMSAAEFNSDVYAWALDPVNGSPVAGATILGGERGKSKTLGTTGADGMLKLPAGVPFNQLAAKKDGSLTPAINQYGGRVISDEERNRLYVHSDIYTALPLYHPGDTAEYVAVVSGYSRNQKSHLLVSHPVTVLFRNANYETLSTVELTTDDFGRISGSFPIPTTGLTGNYSIQIDSDKSYVDRCSVTVSDYKLPSFAVETFPAVTDNGAVTLRGSAMTYSGFPLAGSRVKIAVGVMQWGYWLNARIGQIFYNTECETDDAGNFSIVVPADVLDGSPLPDGRFNAVFTVTSSSGETQDAAMIFSRKPFYRLTGDLPDAIDASKPFAFDVKVVDAENSPVSERVECLVVDRDSLVSTLAFMPGDPVDLSAVPSGSYRLKFKTERTDTVEAETVFYRPTDTVSPEPYLVLWTPTEKITSADRHVEILVGAAYDTNILLTMYADEKILEQRWIEFPAGMRNVSVDIPDDVSHAGVSINAVANYKSSVNTSVDIEILPKAPTLTLKAESMRDRLTPGNAETWTFSVAASDGATCESAVILRMYNAAIDALARSSWSFDSSPSSAPGYWWWNCELGDSYFKQYSWPGKEHKWSRIRGPQWQTYGRRLCGGSRRYKMARTTDSGDFVVEEAKMASVNAKVPATAFAVESDALEDLSEVTVAGYGAAPDEDTSSAFSYRDSEVPLAFFRPMLTTGDDGRLTFSFTVPDANTTWNFNALAFTRSLLSASLSKSIVASKPVMVQPDLPRFLRQGDRAEVRALVMNNSDTEQTVTTVIEIFDPVTGKTVDTVSQTDRMAPKTSAVALITLDAPSTATMLGYRVKSSTEAFADGEQALIPLLEAAQPVITAEPFYIPAGQQLFTTALPRWEQGSRVSLEFCENPAWYVVTALPGLTSAEINTSVNAAGAIFSAAVADGILRSNPSVAKALRQWTAGDRSDSTLVSMLQRNADMKIALLQATPWMMDARSDTERMNRLALLFDRGEIDRTISRGVEVLARMQKSGGGWNWTGGDYEASEWATQRVLSMFGDLNRLGWFPDNKRLSNMTEAAVKWLDARVAEDFRKYPKGNYTQYVYIRDMFPDVRQSSAAGHATSATVQQLIGRWRDLDATGKAVAAVILDNHNYTSTSRQILESLREYAVTSPEKGMWWPTVEQGWWSMNPAAATSLILDAFARIEPQCADVDRIRQWLILQKGAQNWGNSVSASRMVASFIAASGKWLAPARGAVVAVGDNELDITPVDRTLGYLRTDISSQANSGATLSIGRSAEAAPSWGAVYCRGTQSMTAIEPHSVADLSVEKQCLVIDADGTARPMNGRAKVGQRVRVTLTIKSSRAMDYVAILDNRPACFEPVEQLPGRVWCDGLSFYRENSDAVTSLFINRLPVGTYILTYDMWVNSAGVYTMGAASVQSQYQPSLVANSAGGIVTVEP